MLTHLHHPARVGSSHHRWARDAVLAAQVGVAAIVVVTALELRSDRRADPTGDAPPVASSQSVAVTTPATAAGVSSPPGSGEASATTPTEDTNGAAVGVGVGVLHSDGQAVSVGPSSPINALNGPIEVRVIDGSFATVASVVLDPAAVARITDLAAGEYRLIFSQAGPAVQAGPDVAISAASAQLSEPVRLGSGDVLLISLQLDQGATPPPTGL